MIHLVWNLIGAVAAVGLILAALVYFVSPNRGGEMLRRLAVFLAGALVGICLLRQFAACIGPLLLLVVGLAIVIVAYLVREARRSGNSRLSGQHWGAERTPLMPTVLDDEQEEKT
jgi:Na+/melibiose symporter-like transporter